MAGRKTNGHLINFQLWFEAGQATLISKSYLQKIILITAVPSRLNSNSTSAVRPLRCGQFEMVHYFSIAILLSIFFPAFAFAQTKRNSISVELGKSTLIGGLTYDHQLRRGKSGLRVFTAMNLSNYRNAFTAGGGAYYLIGAKKDFLELGSDVGFLHTGTSTQSDKEPLLNYPDFGTESFIGSLNMGYRHVGGKSILRIGVAPFIIKEGIYPGAYMSIGRLLW